MCVMAKNLHLGTLSFMSAIRKVSMDTASQETKSITTESDIMNRTHETNSPHASPMYPPWYPCPEWDMWTRTIRNTREDNETNMAVSASTETEYVPRNESNGNDIEKSGTRTQTG